MSTLTIKKIDETTISVSSDTKGVINELSDFFSFYAPGYKYDKRFQNHIWDGKIRLVNLRTETAPQGLTSNIIKFCNDRGYQFIDETEKYLQNAVDDISNIDQWIEDLKLPFPPRDYQVAAVKQAIRANKTLLVAATGCHAKGTQLRMYDGSLKAVEDIVVGDKLLGVNGEPRTVLKLAHGRDTMYRISNKRRRFKPFVVNSEHVLPLFDWRSKKIVNIPVDEYVTKSKTYKYIHYLLLNDKQIEFGGPKSQLKIDPYFMGIYLGDGHTHSTAVTTMDHEVFEYLHDYIETNYPQLKVRVVLNGTSKAKSYYFANKDRSARYNPLKEDFSSYGLIFANNEYRTKCEQKFIPLQYKQASVADRYQLLAGIIDSDGNLSTCKTYYEITSKSETLIDDIADVAQSLGFVCGRLLRIINGKCYYRLNIIGEINKIPCRIARKADVADKHPNVNPHHVRFEVEKLEEDDYYGVYTDGDHLYYNRDYVLNHNSGKSLIQYMLIRWMLEKDRKVCLIVPSTSLVEQMLNDFKDYSKLNGWDVDKHIHGLYSKIKTTDPYKDQCIVTTWQSICKYDKQLFESWDCIINDETHLAKSRILTDIIAGATNAKFKIGLTGTLANCVCHEFQLTGLFGSPFVVATTKQLQDKGQLNKMKIYMVVMKYPADECKKVWNDVKTLKKTYSDEVEYVNNHAKRQLFVRNLVCSLKGTTLVLFRLREHGEQLYKLIKDKVGDDRPVFHIDGKVDAKTREQIRIAADSNKDCILVFSVATSATGINIKSIENLIINPSKSKIQTLQSIGRSLRLCEGKQHSKVFDLVDDLSTGRHKNYLVKHSMERYQVYCDQGFDVEFKQVQF